MFQWTLRSAALLLALLALPGLSSAEVTFLKITIKNVNVWPTKPDGKCWDPCMMKKYQLPARGAKDFQSYFEDKNFKEACEGSKAPDPLVEMEIGQYEKFTTDKINNSCNPTFNISHVFRVSANDPFTVAVYDNDGGGGVQVKRDLIGKYTAPSVPAELLKGGRLVLKSFGQVEEIVLESEVVKRPALTACEGVYRVRVVEAEVKEKRENGKNWDSGLFGKSKLVLPDVYVSLKVGSEEVKTQISQDTTSAKFYGAEKTIAIKPGTSVSLTVFDSDYPAKDEVIGQTAAPDVCKLISGDGLYTFGSFGQVVKVVVIFEKQP